MGCASADKLSLYQSDISSYAIRIERRAKNLEKILPENTAFDDHEGEHTCELGRKIMHLNARSIYTQSNQTRLILPAIEDVTDREDHRRDLEELVEKRTSELAAARLEAENSQEKAEAALREIQEDLA